MPLCSENSVALILVMLNTQMAPCINQHLWESRSTVNAAEADSFYVWANQKIVTCLQAGLNMSNTDGDKLNNLRNTWKFLTRLRACKVLLKWAVVQCNAHAYRHIYTHASGAEWWLMVVIVCKFAWAPLPEPNNDQTSPLWPCALLLLFVWL